MANRRRPRCWIISTAIVSAADQPFERRGLGWATEDLPVPADLLVYTQAEWAGLVGEGGSFIRTLQSETAWVWTKEPSETAAV